MQRFMSFREVHCSFSWYTRELTDIQSEQAPVYSVAGSVYLSPGTNGGRTASCYLSYTYGYTRLLFLSPSHKILQSFKMSPAELKFTGETCSREGTNVATV